MGVLCSLASDHGCMACKHDPNPTNKTELETQKEKMNAFNETLIQVRDKNEQIFGDNFLDEIKEANEKMKKDKKKSGSRKEKQMKDLEEWHGIDAELTR